MSDKKYFTYFNREEAKAYIGKRCRFADNENYLVEGNGNIGILSEVNSNKYDIFSFRFGDDDWHRFCTPVETKIRPYKDFEELAKEAEEHGRLLREGCVFKIKRKDGEDGLAVALLRNCVLRFFLEKEHDYTIGFVELAKDFVWADGTPCGVEEEV